MTARRDFIKSSLAITAGVVASNVAPALANVESLPKGVIYTKENPGKWAKKVAGHLPVVTVEGSQVTVETKHSMSAAHYIVRHTVVTTKGVVLGEKTFFPTDKKAISVFEIEGNHSVLYATSFCNLHDLWVAEFSV